MMTGPKPVRSNAEVVSHGCLERLCYRFKDVSYDRWDL